MLEQRSSQRQVSSTISNTISNNSQMLYTSSSSAAFAAQVESLEEIGHSLSHLTITPQDIDMSSSTTEARSPGFPPIPFGNLSAKGIDTTNKQYETSYIRTSSIDLPFPHPKWHVHPQSGQTYEVTSPIFEEYDPKSGFVDSVGPVRESVEKETHAGDEHEEGEEEEEPRAGLERLHGWGNKEEEDWEGDAAKEKHSDVWKTEIKGYATYIKWPESSERSSIRREAKRSRNDGAGPVEDGGFVVKKIKRLRYGQ